MYTPLCMPMYSPVHYLPNRINSKMMLPGTPNTPSNFNHELRQVLQERSNRRARNKDCSMLERTSTPKNAEADKRKQFRALAIEEIINSEQTYLNQLKMLMFYFVRPLKEQSIIDASSHSTLFGQIEMIYNLNGELLSEINNDVDNGVAHAFLKMAPFFKLYSVYAFDYRNSLTILETLTATNPTFRLFLEQTETRPEVQRKLNSLMIVPIQRVPRYKLLLQQVLFYTSPGDSDYKLLQESVQQIEHTVSHINSCIVDHETTQLLINLQRSLLHRKPNIVKPSRKILKEGILHKITRNGTEIKRYCILMSDIFMYCKILKEHRPPNTLNENSLECCCIFPLKKTKVYELFPGNFKLTCQGDGVIFGTVEMQLQRTWVAMIRDAIEMHIECRKTLRKESSKRTPMRKKNLKHFDRDVNQSKDDIETIFYNKNFREDSDDEENNDKISKWCFPLKTKKANSISEFKKQHNAMKRSANLETANKFGEFEEEPCKKKAKLSTEMKNNEIKLFGMPFNMIDASPIIPDVHHPLRLNHGSRIENKNGNNNNRTHGLRFDEQITTIDVMSPISMKKHVKFNESLSVVAFDPTKHTDDVIKKTNERTYPLAGKKQASKVSFGTKIYNYIANLF